MFRRCRPLVCATAIGVSFGAQHPTGLTACVGCTASANATASSASRRFSSSSFALMNPACFSGSNLRDTVFGLRCSMPRRCNSAIRPSIATCWSPEACHRRAFTRSLRPGICDRTRLCGWSTLERAAPDGSWWRETAPLSNHQVRTLAAARQVKELAALAGGRPHHLATHLEAYELEVFVSLLRWAGEGTGI